MSTGSSKNWCLTINNPTPADYLCFATDSSIFKYWGYAEETGSNGTLHLQGYVSLVKKSRLAAVRVLFPRAHLEMMRGSFAQNEAYCSKQGDLIQFGEAPVTAGQGEQNRWDLARRLAVDGNFEDIPSDIYLRYFSTLHKIYEKSQENPDSLDGTCGVWIHGAPGTGKSHAVHTKYPDSLLTNGGVVTPVKKSSTSMKSTPHTRRGLDIISRFGPINGPLPLKKKGARFVFVPDDLWSPPTTPSPIWDSIKSQPKLFKEDSLKLEKLETKM
nr:MAG: replication associated protein [Cressdnaviricota sp.]